MLQLRLYKNKIKSFIDSTFQNIKTPNGYETARKEQNVQVDLHKNNEGK